jgi:hypothetical protein
MTVRTPLPEWPRWRDPICPRYGCGRPLVVAKIMAWCPRCKWTTYATDYRPPAQDRR